MIQGNPLIMRINDIRKPLLEGGSIIQTAVLEELEALTTTERLTVIEAALRLIRKDLQRVELPPARTERKRVDDIRRQLATAAKALLSDYKAGGELTIFTALDSEDFYA
jgi:hypothetical protein